MFAQLIDVTGNPRAFPLEEVLDRARELGVRKPVRRRCLNRQKTAPELVLALRPAFEHLQALRDGELDRLVIAALEVQKRHVLDRAPVAAIERLFIVDEE